MPKIDRLPSGSYRMRVYLGKDASGKKVIKSITASNKRDLRIMAARLEADHKQARTGSAMTLQQAMTEYITSCSATLSPSTVRGYTACLRAFSAHSVLMSTKVSSLTRKDVQEAIDGMCRDGTSQKTIRNRYGFLSAVLRQYGMAFDIRLPARERTEIAVPTDAHMRTILDASRGTPLHIPILLASIGGLRRGEICALTMSDVRGSVIHVHGDVVYAPDRTWTRKEIPKTFTSNRYVEMPSEVIDLIREQGFITELSPQALTNRNIRLLARLGLPPYRFHDYRHYMVSSLHAAGVPDAYIMQRGGWSSDSVMKAVYRHTLADHEQTAVQATIDHFRQLVGD